MRKSSKSNCKSASHKMLKDRAKNRVDDLQSMFTDLQYARKESRAIDVTVLEEQVHLMLREWKNELYEPSPASSLQGGSLGFSSDNCRLLQLCEEEDDATSKLVVPKPEPEAQNLLPGENVVFPEVFNMNQMPQPHGFLLDDECKGSFSEVHNMKESTQLDSYPSHFYQDYEPNFYTGLNGPGRVGLYREQAVLNSYGYLANISPPPSAFLGPKCALWDCPRPAQGLDWSQEYCSSFHTALALSEGPPGMIPVLRPGGIGLKDGLLFAALSAKTQGKDVGIPECEGAATAKSPWNAPELFDILILKGETIREWLFFDKPRRAFESGNRKQRSLPDYNGRGWHESRKQVMNEHGGLKRSYYMDPQPLTHYDWHLYEYEVNNCDACALYRLELKLVDGKKSPKTKGSSDSVAVLEKQMGRLGAEFPLDHKRSVKGKTRFSSKEEITTDVYSATNQVGPTNDKLDYDFGPPYNFPVQNSSDYYYT